MMTGTESMSGPPKYGGGSDEPESARERVAVFSFASIAVSHEESGPRGRDLLIGEPSTEKECPRRLVRTDYRASDPKTPVRIRARALQGNLRYDAESVRQFECSLSARCYAADPGCDFSRCNGQPRGRESSRHSTLVQRPQLAGPFGGVSRTRGKPFLRHGGGIGHVGPAVRAAAASRVAKVSRDPCGRAPRPFDTGRSALPHPSAAHGPVLRAGDTDHGSAGKRGLPRGRSPRIPLL